MIQEDLDHDWSPTSDRDEAQGALAEISKELPDLGHPLISKVAGDFTPENSNDKSVRREGITDLSNPMWWKVKTGRWRGAVYQDPDGQAWLCAGGLRREREATDFYASFMAQVQAQGPDRFLPTQEDRERLKDELAEMRFIHWEREIQDRIRDWLVEARTVGRTSHELTDPDGDAIGSVAIGYAQEELDDELLVDILVEFTCTDWRHVLLFNWAEMVMLLSLDPHEQVWRPVGIAGGRSYSIVHMRDEHEAFLQRLEEPPGAPGEARAGAEAHWTHRGRLTESTIDGNAVKGLCGRWFVPRQDHADKEPCSECAAIYQRMSE